MGVSVVVSRVSLIGLGAGLLLTAASSAQAQQAPIEAQGSFQRDRNVGVRERPRPQYDALGLRAGSFLLFPKVELSQAYEDNVFASGTDKAKDGVTSLLPSIVAESQWARHSVRAQVQTNIFQYWKYTTQNNATYAANLSGRLDVVRGTVVTAGASFDHLVEPRTSPSSPQAAVDPVEFDQAGFDLGASREINRLRLSTALRFRNYRFDSVSAPNGTVIDTTYRNNHSWEGSARADYAISPALAVYGTASGNAWDFREPTAFTDLNRDASGYQVAVGTDFELTSLARGQLQVGYLDQSFDDPRVGKASGVGLLGRVEYFPTQLLTVSVNAERTVQATGVIGAAGTIHGVLGAQADYELLRNLILTARAQRIWDDYRGINRQDDIWTAAIGANYLLNRRFGVSLTYNFYDQGSSGPARGREFSANRLQLGLVAQY